VKLRRKTFKNKLIESLCVVVRVNARNSWTFQNSSEKMFDFFLFVVVCEDVYDGDNVYTAFVVGDDTSSEFLVVVIALKIIFLLYV
jgi:hypothetical protein